MDDFQRVKDAVDLVDVVSRYVKELKRAGARMVACCPFHAEKSPSFGIPVGQQYFKCFGCGKGGDVFTFVAEMERISRVEALHRLAEEAHIELSGHSSSDRDEKERLLRALAAAQDLYRRAWQSEIGAAARALIESRRLTSETSDRFGLGYAPVTPGDPFRSGVIANRLVAAGHRREDVIAAGIAHQRDGGGELVDALRDRVTIPIRDERGRVIAFGGRRMRDGEEVKEPKYLNSRETPVFSKSRVLHGLDRARPQILKEGRLVLVEGYMDVILAHQGGLDMAVAALGTSVTAEHAKLLARLAPKAVLFLDGDPAGQRAAERAVPLLIGERLDVRVLVLTSDKDPGDYFARGSSRADFEALLEKDGTGGVDYLLERAGRRDARTIDDRIRVARRVAEALAQVGDPLARGAAVSHVARQLDLPSTELDQALGLKQGRRAFAAAAARGPGSGDGKSAPVGASPAQPRTAQVVAEEELLISLLKEPILRPTAARRVPEGTFTDPVRARLFLGLVAEPASEPEATVAALLAKFSNEPDAQQTLVDLVSRPASAEPDKLFDGAMGYLERQRQRRQASDLRARFEKELASGDAAATKEFLQQYDRFRRGGGAT
jgi:DNA primase